MSDQAIKALAVFLSDNLAHKSIKVEMGDPMAKEWANLRIHLNIPGYQSVEDTEKQLKKMFSKKG